MKRLVLITLTIAFFFSANAQLDFNLSKEIRIIQGKDTTIHLILNADSVHQEKVEGGIIVAFGSPHIEAFITNVSPTLATGHLMNQWGRVLGETEVRMHFKASSEPQIIMETHGENSPVVIGNDVSISYGGGELDSLLIGEEYINQGKVELPDFTKLDSITYVIQDSLGTPIETFSEAFVVDSVKIEKNSPTAVDGVIFGSRNPLYLRIFTMNGNMFVVDKAYPEYIFVSTKSLEEVIEEAIALAAWVEINKVLVTKLFFSKE